MSVVSFPTPHRYYAFDEAFVREVLGKKLSKGTKKDLDDISTKTGITLKSCRRQVGTAPICSAALCTIPLVPASPPAYSNTSVAVPSFPLSSLLAPSRPSPTLEPE